MEKEIQLGDKVKDIHTGFTGIAIYKTFFVNGCTQFGVVPKVSKDVKIPEEIGIDSQSLVIVARGKKGKEIDQKKIQKTKKKILESLEEESTGGPMTKAKKMRGF